ncbi:methylisocitrate lyase [Oxyplasma meridianum]|uniref:Methylisocitrate lyase n=1 Tax=Oxyplasma meridianum TaxID=3073602 RepID=A0AAX4NEN6_9ARCH
MSRMRDNVNLGPRGFRELMKAGFISIPGVFDGISAILAERAGFKAGYLSGSAVAGVMGLPDLSVTTLTEVAFEVQKITSITPIPIIVDADTGFGETMNVSRTVRLLERSGAAGMHLEDQVLPKRCGHLNGKKIVEPDEMIKKIISATQSRKDPDFVIIARTDARSVNGIDDAIERANSYIEAGADVIFSEALESHDEFRKFAKSVKAPLLANMTEFGKSPLISTEDLEKMGYSMAIFPLTAFRATLKTMETVYGKLFREGTQTGLMDMLMTRSDFYSNIGYQQYENDEREILDRS